MPEALTQDRERAYLEYFYRNWGAKPDVMSGEDVSEYLRTYCQASAMRAGFNYYRAYHQDVVDNQEALAHRKLKMPVLALSGSKGRGRGGDVVLASAHRVAENVRGGEIADCGHWIPEEKPEELLQELFSFFTEDNDM